MLIRHGAAIRAACMPFLSSIYFLPRFGVSRSESKTVNLNGFALVIAEEMIINQEITTNHFVNSFFNFA